MTIVVGVFCADGVVIGTDSAATFAHGQFRTVEQLTDKLYVHGNVIVAGTGPFGLGQRFCEVVRKCWDSHKFTGSPIDVAKLLCAAGRSDFGETSAPMGQYGALVAFPCGHKPSLCEFQVADFQPEMKDERIWYASLGSAQPITDPFLALMRQVFWQDGLPSVEDASFVVTWAIEHAIQVNPGGVNGPTRIAVLEAGKKGRLSARILDNEEVDLHRQNIDDAIEHLREFRHRHQQADAHVPEVPKAE